MKVIADYYNALSSDSPEGGWLQLDLMKAVHLDLMKAELLRGNRNPLFGTKTTNFKISLTRFRFASLVLVPTSITVTALTKTPLSNIVPITYPNCHWFPLYCWVLEEQYQKHKLFFSFCSIFVSVGNCSRIPSSMATKSHL